MFVSSLLPPGLDSPTPAVTPRPVFRLDSRQSDSPTQLVLTSYKPPLQQSGLEWRQYGPVDNHS